ncbi:hypothetical protein [Psychrobium sp. 1_MG-2023]|uniref:hypothetical protein n=1 Tax=Psychrobium sp. 1_MG-2023 TaxID=3062624 RepID=UPI000C34CB77|nr:hypothetical protein [Psychrobium sp. 1_MG-2023]MDP2562496.1 hypothetical protein [Psychrobium sp. 1_MG-2023]PKF54329.1 hypothetical protein CW748_16510 [Alteromonadales bacterium alter-6D02]
MSDIIFELSQDPKLLEQYYQLRHDNFNKTLGLTEFDGKADVNDLTSDIFIARVGSRCLGGVRICGRGFQGPLPLEYRAQGLIEELPQLNLSKGGYCQWMRLSLAPFGDIPYGQLYREFTLALAVLSAELGYQYAFCVSSKTHQRLYKQLFSSNNYLHFQCETDKIRCEQDFDGLEHLLYATKLQQRRVLAPRKTKQAQYKINSLGYSECLEVAS